MMNAKSAVRCWQYQLSPAQKAIRCSTYHLCQKISECVCLQRGCIYLKLTRAYGNIPSISALKVQESAKDLEAEADKVHSWVLAFEYKVVVRKSTRDASDHSGV